MVNSVDVDLEEAANLLDEEFDDHSFKVATARFMEVYKTVEEESIEVSPPLENSRQEAKEYLDGEYDQDIRLERVNRSSDVERYLVR